MKRDTDALTHFTPRDDYTTIEQFYPYYLSQHSNNVCRLLHFIGTTIAIRNILMLLYTFSIIYLVYAIVGAYSLAWIGHFFVEKNKPATFNYPVKSLICDFIMYGKIITGQIHNDFKKHGLKNIKQIDTELF
jgi:hypothetical protein